MAVLKYSGDYILINQNTKAFPFINCIISNGNDCKWRLELGLINTGRSLRIPHSEKSKWNQVLSFSIGSEL